VNLTLGILLCKSYKILLYEAFCYYDWLDLSLCCDHDPPPTPKKQLTMQQTGTSKKLYFSINTHLIVFNNALIIKLKII